MYEENKRHQEIKRLADEKVAQEEEEIRRKVPMTRDSNPRDRVSKWTVFFFTFLICSDARKGTQYTQRPRTSLHS